MKTLRVKSLLFALAFFLSLFTAYANASVSDDMNGNVFNLHDVISSLKVLAGMTPSSDVHKRSVENSSEKIGVKEAIYILRNTNGMSRRLRNAVARNIAASPTACFMKVTHGTGAINEQVKVEIILEGSGVAGAAFTIEYGPHLILNTVESDFFDTFASMEFSSQDGLDRNGLVEGYDRPLVYNTDEAVGRTMIAAARSHAGGSSGDVLFTLFFSLKSGASPGTYPINIKPTVLNNTDAGYSAEAIDMLIGIDGDTYPVLMNSDVNENGYSAHVEPGSVTYISGKRDEPNAENEPSVSDMTADMGDVILALRALMGMGGDGISLELDVSKDGKIGPEDPVYMLKFIADSQAGDEITPLQSEKSRIASPDVSESDLGELVAGNTEFALNFYHAIAGEDGNIFFSPYSISLALAMTYAGARNETESQMADTLHFTFSRENLHPAFNALDLELVSRGKGAEGQDGEGFRLNIANSIWGQKDYPFLPSFLDTLAENYGAGLNLLDFSSAPDASRTIINNWVSDKTEEKIKDLLPTGSISSVTRLVLTNAIYFNAAWKFPFEEYLTHDAPFYLTDGGSVTVPMMSMPDAERFGYTKGDGYQAVEVRYDGDDLSMVILVPDAGQFAAFETLLTKERFDTISEALVLTNMELELPKFRHESASVSIKDMLSLMGMPAAFGGDADFSGMNGERGLFISDVIHKAYVAVDEAGTEAAAATAVIMDESAAMPPDKRLTVDRPFIFLIRDIRTKAILFIGRIVNPA